MVCHFPIFFLSTAYENREITMGKKTTPFGLQALHIQGRNGSALHRHVKSTAAPQGILWLRRGDKTWDARGFQRATRKGIWKWSHRNMLLSDDTGLEQQPVPAAFPCQLSLPGWVSASGNEGALQCFTQGLISIHCTIPNLTASTEIGPVLTFAASIPWYTTQLRGWWR